MADSEQVPLAVTRLLSARYPTLEIDPRWLQTCVQDLCQRDPSLRTGPPDKLARAVRQALLDSDLADVVPPSYTRLSPTTLRSSHGKIGCSGKPSFLVQIESMIDIGFSAAAQLEIAEARREARRANIDPNEVPAEEIKAASTASSRADHMADFQAQEDDKIQATTMYPRRMLKLELNDGSKNGTVFAIELQRVPALDMNTTNIGSKLLLKGTLVKDGYFLLTPQTVVVEGGVVREKKKVAEDNFINMMRARLGKAPLNDTDPGMVSNGRPTSNAAAASSSSNTTTGARPQRDFSPDEDESALLAALEAEEEILASVTSARKFRSNGHNTSTPSTIHTRTVNASASSSEQRPPAAKLPVAPKGMSQSSVGKSRSQQSITAATMPNATQENPISLIDSDEDFGDEYDDGKLFPPTGDFVLDIITERAANPVDSGNRRAVKASEGASNSRYDPIVIESSPEP